MLSVGKGDGFTDIGLADFLALDRRPVFVLDQETNPVPERAGERSDIFRVKPVFVNPSCQTCCPAIYAWLQGSHHATHRAFDEEWLSWAQHAPHGGTFQLDTTLWELTVLHNRWRIFTGSAVSGPSSASQVSSVRRTSEFDVALDSGCISEAFYKQLQDVDWGATCLGAPHEWPTLLRHAVSLTLHNPGPCCINWGPERTMLYNEAYSTILKDLHPSTLGASPKVIFSSFWDPFEELMHQVERTGRYVGQEATPVVLDRANGLNEQGFFSYFYIPLKDTCGNFMGILNVASEVTDQVVSERRTTNVLRIGEVASTAVHLDEFWHRVLSSFDFPNSEVPFATILCRGHGNLAFDSVDETPLALNETLAVLGSYGTMPGLGPLPETIEISAKCGFCAALRRSATLSYPLLIRADDLRLPISEIHETELSTEDSRLVVCPLQVSSRHPMAWLLIGVHHHRPYDQSCKNFHSLLTHQIELGAKTLMLLAEERAGLESTAELATLEAERLMTELAAKKREAEDSAMRFLEFAKHAPVGVYTFDPQGEILFANETWYRMFGIPNDMTGAKLWRDYVHPEDLADVDQKWRDLEKFAINHADFEFRVRSHASMPWSDMPEMDCGYLSSSCFAEADAEGNLKSVTGVILDNTLRKAHERDVADRLRSALEAKRTQENFMDMVSHEMRNPLNAIVQCAEEASQIHAKLLEELGDNPKLEDIRASLEAIETIIYCSHFQRQIIDDVLTISKLDSRLLTLAPTAVQPISAAHQAVNIHSSEIRAADITVKTTQVDEATESTVMMDAGRVLQILINLIGNAVKFTNGRPQRHLDVEVSICDAAPPPPTHVQFAPSNERRSGPKSIIPGAEGHKPVWIYYMVRDTGPGLTQKEVDSLFQRFRQASPRTHAQYGGSGLGLFICRELAELHGGEIGIKSEAGHGSAFAFYVQGYRPPPTDDQHNRSSLISYHGLPSDPVSGPTQPTDRPDPQGQQRCRPDPALPLEPRKTAFPITVLIVEDNLINQTVLNRQLKRAGFQTLTANDGQQALDIISTSNLAAHNSDPDDDNDDDDNDTTITLSHQLPTGPFSSSPAGPPPPPPPHRPSSSSSSSSHSRVVSSRHRVSVVLCDLEMPVMDGLTCVRRVRELQRLGRLRAHVPMVAVTGNARNEQVRGAREAGFDEVVSKPYEIARLVGLCRGLAGG